MMLTPTGFPVFHNIKDLANFMSLLLPIITHYDLEKWRPLFPEIPFIDPPDPILPDQGDGNKSSTDYCGALSVSSDKINIQTAALAQECFFGVL